MKVDVGGIAELETPKNKDESCMPLDLRLSPALRRDFVAAPSSKNEIRRTQSDTSIITNYVSCASETIATTREILKDETDSDDDDDSDDIFYTPRRWMGDSQLEITTDKSFTVSAERESLSTTAAYTNNNDEVKDKGKFFL
jgi:hypothetical protein